MNDILQLDNATPKIYSIEQKRKLTPDEEDNAIIDLVDAEEIFDQIRSIKDPEHPLTLEELHVIEKDRIHVDNDKNYITVYFTPTIPHCSMVTIIGLCICLKLKWSFTPRFKITVLVTPGTHQSEAAVNKQLNDKERIAAALENSSIFNVLKQCVQSTVEF